MEPKMEGSEGLQNPKVQGAIGESKEHIAGIEKELKTALNELAGLIEDMKESVDYIKLQDKLSAKDIEETRKEIAKTENKITVTKNYIKLLTNYKTFFSDEIDKLEKFEKEFKETLLKIDLENKN